MLEEIEIRRTKEINSDFYIEHVKDYDGLQEKLDELKAKSNTQAFIENKEKNLQKQNEKKTNKWNDTLNALKDQNY